MPSQLRSHAHTGSTGDGQVEATIVRSILDRGRQGVLVVGLGVGLEDLEGDRAGLELKACRSLGFNEAVPTGVVNLLVVRPVVVAQGVDLHDAVGVGGEGVLAINGDLVTEGGVVGNEVVGAGGQSGGGALVDRELGVLKLGGRISCGNLGDLDLAELGDDLRVRVLRGEEWCPTRDPTGWPGCSGSG